MSHDKDRVLLTVAKYFNEGDSATDIEKMSVYLMEFVLIRPRTFEEIQRYAETLGIVSQPSFKILMRIIEQYSIATKAEDGSGGAVFYSGLQGQSAKYKADALKIFTVLDDLKRQQLDELISKSNSSAGLLKESLNLPQEVIDLANSLGLIDVITVNSPIGNAEFITPPIKANGLSDEDGFEDDVFHNAKVLLSSFRFGQHRSQSGRGRILAPQVLVNKLIENNEVGPCTAIGQDYTILEIEGVIDTIRATDKPGEQFYMSLRRREPAIMVKTLLDAGFEQYNQRGSMKGLSFPVDFQPPESSRIKATSQLAAGSLDSRNQLIYELRMAKNGS